MLLDCFMSLCDSLLHAQTTEHPRYLNEESILYFQSHDPHKKSQIGTFNDEIKSREEENFAGKYNGDRGAQPLFGSQSLAA